MQQRVERERRDASIPSAAETDGSSNGIR